MQQNIIDAIIQRSNRLWFGIGTVALLSVIITGILSADYLHNFLNGPFDFSGENILAAENASTFREEWITVAGEESFNTGYEYITMDEAGNEEVIANYAALLFDDRFLIVETDTILGEEVSLNFTGKLVDMPNSVRYEVVEAIEYDYPQLAGLFLPVMLDARSDYREHGLIGVAIAAVTGLVGLYALARAIYYGRSPDKHPIMNKLSWFGDPRTIADEINEELHQTYQTIHSLMFTKNWLVRLSSRSFDATRITDLAWIYQEITKHRKYGFVVNKTYALVVWDRHGNQMTVTGNRRMVEEMLAYTAKRAPWAAIGYDDKTRQYWATQRHNFLSEIDHRRQVLRDRLNDRRIMQTA